MKKIILLASFCVAGYATASTGNNESVKKNNEKTNYDWLKKGRIEYGLGVVDGPNGSCVYYGTYYNGDNGVSIFTPASQATNATMELPKCSGDGSNMA